MTTSREYRQFAHQCIEWAAEADTNEDRNAFLDLARDWTFAALCLDRFTPAPPPVGEWGRLPEESPPPQRPRHQRRVDPEAGSGTCALLGWPGA
jgi:hypothetical protein